MTSTQQRQAEEFHRLHDDLLILPNAWDPPSARMVEAAGAAAVATTSAGVAWSRGVADGGGLDRATALDAAARVIGAVTIPVTVDLEGGYPGEPGGVETAVEQVIEAGAVGINLEDSAGGALLPLAAQAETLRRVRKLVDSTPVRLFVNARIDTFLLAPAGSTGPDLVAATIERARTFVKAGADGVFVPGVTDPALVRDLVAGVPAPLNLMVGRGAPPLARYAELGVRRISAGPTLTLSAYRQVRDWAGAMLAGSLEDVPEGMEPGPLQAGPVR
ncbi:isocitrate lyase/PEP mutase family protein [Microlunatus parietis]|uniref:2-methylisocitrate lyase-like PEP mutase family enzyme n=1 Tax=Microlunatus parietis TaxID=682979 RepID=A0A7Y9I9Y8_9ACTN|nr:isocitrate lyase/phosphoenolpyruvate mutase family protein [Microlunatus parietis]NYE72743.1 2-methylisocitrate lyase-like PEP mutase family enzyme [Microlunatus parietis]